MLPDSKASSGAPREGTCTVCFTASVRAASRRILITVGNPKGPDARWTFDAEAQRLDVAH